MTAETRAKALEQVFGGGGEMGAWLRSLDWTATPLGPVLTWPQSLKTTVSLCLRSPMPILISWGPEFVLVYNDACRPLVGPHQSQPSFGRSGQTCCPQFWALISPLLHQVFTTGQAISSDCAHLPYPCDGQLEGRNFTLACSPILDESGQIGGVFTVMTEQSPLERRSAAHHAITRILAEAISLAAAVPAILQALCENLDWQLGVIWEVDPEVQKLRCVDCWHVPSLPLQDFMAVNQVTTFTPGVGLPGRIWASGQPAWVTDLQSDLNFPRAKLAAAAGLCTAFGFPILLGNEVLGVIECFSDRPQVLDLGLLQMMAATGSDIGQFIERQEAEQRLLESQELFYRFMNNSPTTAFIKDEAGRYLYINRRIEELTQLSPSDCLGRTDFDLFPAASARSWWQNDLEVLQTGQTLLRLETLPSDTGDRHFMSFKFPLQDARGRRLVGGLSLDISDRLRTEAALRQSETRYRSIFETAGVAMFEEDFTQVKRMVDTLQAEGVTDLRAYLSQQPEVVQAMLEQVKIRDLNQEGLKLFGATSKTELMVSLAQLLTPENHQTFLEEILALAAGRRYLKSETTLRTLQGHPRHVLFIIMFPPPEAGYERVLVSLLDISERVRLEAKRQQAELALRHSEERFRLAMRAITGLVYDWEVATGQVYRSEGLFHLIGIWPESVPATTAWWTERIHPDERDWLLQQMAETLANGSDRYGFEYRVRHANGDWIDVWDRGYVIRDNEGQVIRVVGSTADISDRKRAEQERELLLEREQLARAQAEAANRIKDEFLAVLSHELRSPLNPILGWSRLLQIRQFDPAKTAEALATIERNAKLQMQLVEDLLDVARILRGKLTLKVAPVDLAFVIQAAIETMQTAAAAKSIQIHTELTPISPIPGDATRLQQVVWNLLANAIKFTPPGGQVEIKLSLVPGPASLSAVEPQPPPTQNQAPRTNNQSPITKDQGPGTNDQGQTITYVQLTVSDTGKGIHPEFLPHLFEYFRQADASTTRSHGGLGLGLAIVRHLVELHGGTVKADSSGEGQGATFTVLLPRLITPSTSSFLQTLDGCETAPTLVGVRVLVVDDDADNRNLVTVILEQAGAKVLAAASAQEALSLVPDFRPNLLVSDIGMPHEDGFRLLQQVRSLPPEQGGQIPAIALTAYARTEDQQQVLAAGFQRHLAKPIEPSALVATVASVMDSYG